MARRLASRRAAVTPGRRDRVPEQQKPNPAALRGLTLALALAFVGVGVYQPLLGVRASHSGRDFASYHYAAQAAMHGDDPYDTAGLGQRSAAEGTRKAVHPFFYPPPFLLGLLWSRGLSLSTAYQTWFWMSQAAVLATAAALRRWLGAPVWLLLALLVGLSPIADSAKMGQANALVLLLAVLGLWRSNGLLVGAAAMAKMSPALYLAGWLGQGRWRPALVACGAAVGLSLLSLPLVGIDVQLRFYTEILPGFASGDYHGLRVPITLPSNHSWPDLLNQAWPGPSKHRLAPGVQTVASLSSLLLVGLCAAAARRWRQPEDGLQQGLIAGALTVVLTLTPVYTYEHHLLFMLLPATAALTAALQLRPTTRGLLELSVVGAFFTGLPLSWMRWLQGALSGSDRGPGLLIGPAAELARWLLQESKLFGPALLGVACLWAARQRAIREPTVLTQPCAASGADPT